MPKKVEDKGPRTKVILCGCPSAYQDQRYGQGMRLHNLAPKVGGATAKGWRCTVCDRPKTT